MPRHGSSDLLHRLRQFFADCNYTRDGIRHVLGSSEVASHRHGNVPLFLHRTREPSPLNTLIRLFTIGLPMSSAAVLETIPEWVVTLCVDAELLGQDIESLTPRVGIYPFEQFLVASDRSLDIEKADRPEIVLGINPTTWLLFRFTLRIRAGSALDIGTGGGAHALAASLHHDRVVATDLNPRAIEYAAFNAVLNGVENVDWRIGDSFNPVRGEKFDLIVANPPFFVTPTSSLTFCENSMELDLFCRHLVKQAPTYLNEGGYFQMLFECAEVQGQTWQDRLNEWVDGTGLDAWILRGDSEDSAQYAHKRIREISSGSFDQDKARYKEWIAYYKNLGLRAVHGGLMTLRKRSGRNWIRIEDLPMRTAEPYGEAVLRGFEAREFLERHATDDQFLDFRPKLSQDAELIAQFRSSERGWTEVGARLRLVKGLLFAHNVQPQVASFIGRMDGTRTVRESITNFANDVKADPATVERECVAIIRRLIETGFLLI